MLNFRIYFWHKYKTPNKKTKEKRLDLIEKVIIYSLRNTKVIKTVKLKMLKT